MIHAYNEAYLGDAMKNLGEAFDYAVRACKLSLSQFIDLFIASGYATSFERGTPRIVSGLSGTELAMEIICKSNLSIAFPEAQTEYDFSAEYWCGWSLSYYQWVSGKRFKSILENLPIEEIHKLYSTLHEASEDKFVDTANAIIARNRSATRLQRQRKRCGYSQRELADRAGINLRTLQQYESRAKDLSKAAVESVVALSNTLGCTIDDILE